MTNSENEVFPGTANVKACCKINGALCVPYHLVTNLAETCAQDFSVILKIYKNKNICALG